MSVTAEAGKGTAREGLEASFGSLVRCRPDRKVTGFAPGGKVRTHQFGANRSVFRGRGMEFDESRAYQPGDDARAIDWRVTARRGTLHTKLFHEERERPVLLLADLRRSMQFGTRKQFKSVLAARIAAALAWVGVDGGDRVGGFVSTPGGLRSFPASRNMSAVLRLLKALAEGTRLVDEPGSTADTSGEVPMKIAVDRLRKVARPGTLVFIVSDYNDFDAETERAIQRLSLHAHVTNIVLYDALETALPHGDQRVTDGRAVLSLSALGRPAREAHERAFAARVGRIEAMARSRGMAFLTIPTTGSESDAVSPRLGRLAVGQQPERRAA